MLFRSPSGVGRKTTALAFAQALLCRSRVRFRPVREPSPLDGGEGRGEGAAPGVDGCGACTACRKVQGGVHPDVMLILPTPPESNPKGPLALRIESIRALERLAALRPAEAPWKVFIVDEADRMTAATPQAFLKTLEEPPDHTVIILILSQLRGLPATVLSRCQIVRFGPRWLDGTLALLPDGRDASRRRALDVLAEAETGGAAAILRTGEEVGRERQMAETMVETYWLWYRDLLSCQAGAGDRLRVFGAAAADRADGRSLDAVLAGLTACREAHQALQGNVSPRLTVEVLLNRLVSGKRESDHE